VADYEGRVRLTADTSQADKELNSFVKRVERPVGINFSNAGILQAEKSFTRLRKNIEDLNRTPLNILKGTGAGSSAQADTFRQLTKNAKDFFNSVASGDRSLASTTAGLRQQASAFRDLADNINFTNESQRRFFRDFTQGAEIARTKASGAAVEQLRALQDLYQSGVGGFKQDISPRAGGLNQLLNLGKDLPRTKAALSEYRAELSRVYDLVETRSLSGGIIAVEISNVEKELLKIEQDRAEANNQINNIKKASYALTGNQLSLEEENLATLERQVDARRRAQQAANDLYNRDKAVSRDFGVSPAMTLRPAGVSDEEVALRNLIATQGRLNAIEEENLAAVERRIGARQQELAVANQLVREQRQQAVEAYNRDRALSRDFGVSPAMTLRPAGMTDEAVSRRNLVSDRTKAAAEASAFNAFSRQAEEVAGDVPTLKAIERNREKIRVETEREAQAQARITNRVSAIGRATELRRTGGLSFEERLGRARPDVARSGAGQGLFRGSPRQAFGEGLIGGAFPLLFGQGLGASIGGAAGGFSGGLVGGSFGFGLSLVGTALGQAVDNTVKNLGDLASSLKSPTDAIAALETSGFRVSDTLKFQVQQLQSVGRAYDAQTLVLQEVEKRLGAGSAQQLNALTTEQRRLEDQYARMAGELQQSLLPALIGATGFIADLAAGVASIPKPPEWLTRAINLTSPVTAGAQTLFDAASNRGRATAARTPARRALSPQEAFADESSRVQESRRLSDQVQSAYREAFKLQRQAYDLQYEGARFNKEVADYVWNKEGQIFALRQQAAEKQAENIRAAAQNRIEQGDLDLRGAFAGAVGFEQQLLTNVRETMRTRKEGEADIEQSRKRLELTMAKLNRDTEDFKRTTAREIEDIERRKLSYVRSVEDYKVQVADYVLQRSREAADAMRQAMTLPEVGAGGGGGATGGGLAAAIDRIGGAYQFRGTTLLGNKRPGDYQSDPRENFFFDRRPELIDKAKARIGTLTRADMAALAFTVLTEAGPTDIGKMDVAANLLVRSAKLGNAPISAVAKQPGQYEGVFKYGRIDLESEVRGRQLFGSRYDQTLNLLRGGMTAPGGAMPSGVIARTGATGIGSGAHLDVRWADGRPITSADADRFIRVAGKVPSSFGVSSPYGPRQAPVPGASTFHRGIDFPTPAGLPISLTGGARLTGSMTEAQSGGGGVVGIIDTPMGQMKLLHLERVIGTPQARASMQISGAPTPRFNEVPIGPTPAAAPINAQREALRTALNVGEQEAQKILEDQIKLRQKGVELGQIEQILNANQLPQLRQQGEELRRQVQAREQNVNLSDVGASVADLEAERAARLTQILKDRANALAQIESKVKDPKDLAQARADVNRQSALALEVAVNEEEQRRKNLDLTNQLQASEGARAEILQLQQSISAAKVEAASLERRELEANNVELLKTTTLYQRTGAAQRERLESLTAELQELNKQNRVTAEIVQLEDALRAIRTESAAIQAGRLRATEVEQIRLSRGYREGSEAQRAEMEMLAAKTEELRKQNELGALQVEARFTGAGIRAGYVGQSARAFEDVMKNTGDMDQAVKMAEATKVLESQQLVWQSLESNIVSVSDAISGGLTNGLLDIIEGSREIEDVGREVLSGIARSFADSAQQQLNALVQRQLTGLIGSPLAGFLGGGQAGGAASAASQAAGAAGVQALGSASLATTGAVTAFGVALQTVTAQMALSGALGGGGMGSIFSGASSNLFSGSVGALPDFASMLGFGGFLAEGGVTRPNKAYVVGEKEPEFFFPGVTGRVVPRSDLEKAAALQQDSASPEPIDIRYTVTEQRGERYVTEEQFRKGMAATTKRAQAVTYAGMRQSKEIRNYVGV
jgi:hypothetical protein